MTHENCVTDSTFPITVAIVEDDPEVRRLFEDAVRSNSRLSLLFSAATAVQAMQLAAQRHAQVYLVDLGLPDKDGRDLIRWLSVNQPNALSMVVTVFADEEHVVTSLEAGAVGYLLKDTPTTQIAEGIVEMFEGASPISPSVARTVIRRFTAKPVSPIISESRLLSPRELEVLRLIEKGLSYEETAQVMTVTWHTVTSHLRQVYRKLQVNSRGQAVFEARQRGIL